MNMPATVITSESQFHPGTVTLVGAGPGDPELLTIKAAKAIAAATVLLVDDLVSEGVLAHASPTARIVHVGKRGGCKSTPQAFIEKLMIMAAREGEVVVRLKGGDPFIFGRELAVVHVRIGAEDRGKVAAALTSHLRSLDAAAWTPERDLCLLLPEVDADGAVATIDGLLAALPASSFGYAVAPRLLMCWIAVRSRC